LSAALEYHRATDYAPGDWEEQEDQRYIGDKPAVFKDYGDAERLPLELSAAGPLLRDGAGIVGSQGGRDYGGGTIHWRAYSSAGGLFPVEAYVADADGLYSFDPLTPGFVAVGGGDASERIAAAVAAEAGTFVVLTGIHGRTGWKYLERGYRHIWWDAGTMLANLLALAAADDLSPRLYVGFVDSELDAAVNADGVSEYALAVLALGRDGAAGSAARARCAQPQPEASRRFAFAEAAHTASKLGDADAVRSWREQGRVNGSEQETPAEEPKVARQQLLAAIRARRSVRRYAPTPLPRPALEELLRWSEAPIPADVSRVVEQRVTVAAVEGLDPGLYDAQLNLLRTSDEQELREAAWFAAMEQDHPKLAAVDVWQLADLEDVVARLGDRGYRWAQLEAGIRAGRLQVGAVMLGWGAAACTFYDLEVSKLLETHEAPMLMVAVGPRG